MSSAPTTAAPQGPPKQFPWWQFSLGELMFFMAMAAVCSAIWKANLWLGIAVLFVFVPTTWHTLRTNRTCQRLNISLMFGDQIWNFLFSGLISGLAVGMYIANIVVLVVPCLFIYMVLFVIFASPTTRPQNEASWLFIPVVIIALPVPFKILNHFKLRAALTELAEQQTPEAP